MEKIFIISHCQQNTEKYTMLTNFLTNLKIPLAYLLYLTLKIINSATYDLFFAQFRISHCKKCMKAAETIMKKISSGQEEICKQLSCTPKKHQQQSPLFSLRCGDCSRGVVYTTAKYLPKFQRPFFSLCLHTSKF